MHVWTVTCVITLCWCKLRFSRFLQHLVARLRTMPANQIAERFEFCCPIGSHSFHCCTGSCKNLQHVMPPFCHYRNVFVWVWVGGCGWVGVGGWKEYVLESWALRPLGSEPPPLPCLSLRKEQGRWPPYVEMCMLPSFVLRYKLTKVCLSTDTPTSITSGECL